jgi:hypothetical protein
MQFNLADYVLPIFAIILIFGSIFGLYLGAKRRNMDIKEYLNVFFLEAFDLFLVIFLIDSYLAESIIATVLHPAGNEQIISISGRFLNHTGASLLGFVCAVYSAKAIAASFEALPYFFNKKNGEGKIVRKSDARLPVILILIAIATTSVALYVPYYNTSIIAKGLGQMQGFNLAWSSLMHPFTDNNILLRMHGFPLNTEISDHMGYNLYASVVLMKLHIFGSLLKSLMAAADSLVTGAETYVTKYEKYQKSLRKSAGEDINEKINKRAEEKAKRSSSDKESNSDEAEDKPNDKKEKASTDAIEIALSILPEFKDENSKLLKFKDKIIKRFEDFDLSESANFTAEFNAIKSNIETIQKDKSLSDKEKENRLGSCEFSVRSLITAAKADSGLELTI